MGGKGKRKKEREKEKRRLWKCHRRRDRQKTLRRGSSSARSTAWWGATAPGTTWTVQARIQRMREKNKKNLHFSFALLDGLKAQRCLKMITLYLILFYFQQGRVQWRWEWCDGHWLFHLQVVVERTNVVDCGGNDFRPLLKLVGKNTDLFSALWRCRIDEKRIKKRKEKEIHWIFKRKWIKLRGKWKKNNRKKIQEFLERSKWFEHVLAVDLSFLLLIPYFVLSSQVIQL